MATRQKTIELKVLRILKDCGEYMLPEESLCEQLRVAIRPPPTTQEIMTAVAELDRELKILGVRNDDEIRWKITDRGVAAIFEADSV